MRAKTIFLILILLAPIFSIISLSTPQTPEMHVYYSRYDSIYSKGVFGMIPKGVSNSAIFYTVSAAYYNNTISGNNQALHVTYNRTTYILTFTNVKLFNGTVRVTVYENNTMVVFSTIPNLIRVIVYSAGQAELVWAGIDSSNASITALSYVNGTGIVTLQFANGTSIANISFPIKLNSTLEKKVSLPLAEMSVQVKNTVEFQETIQNQIPRRYSPMFINVVYNGSAWNNESGYTVTVAYFNGTLTPAMVWKGMGLGLAQGIMGAGRYQISAETIEFYGENGTTLGYVHMTNVNGSINFSMGPFERLVNVEFSEIKIVIINGVKPVHAEYIGKAYLNGNEVLITATEEGNASSTAYVNFTHVVTVHHHKAVLVLISLNGTAKYVVILKGNTTANVTVVKPENVTETTVEINGNNYVAQKVVVNNVSNYILFNVTLIKNNSAIAVYKVVNGQLVMLNTSNYFVSNGKVVIFDDPSTTYYVVYGVTQPSSTTQTQSSNNMTATPTPLVSPSSSSFTNAVLYIGIIIAVVLIIAGALIALRRR